MPTLTLGMLADAIRQSTVFNVITGRKNKAADYRVVFGTVADAVALLEGLQRGSQLLPPGTTAPSSADGLAGDAYINSTTSDYYYKAATGWQLVFRLKGADGHTPQKGIDYFDGRTPRKGTDYFDGVNGKSTYQLWVDAGNVGTVSQFLASQHGADGLNGARGSLTRWESFAPTNESGNVGDTWYYAISATKYALYECLGPQLGASQPSENPQAVVVNPAAWRLRFTSPDAATSTGTGGGSANFPVQSPTTTTGKSLMSSGVTGAEFWGYPNRFGYKKKFVSLLADEEKFFQATQILRIERDSAVATLSYSINGTAAVVVPFANGSMVYVPSPAIAITAGSIVVWTITYANSASVAYVEIFASETLPNL